MESLVILLLIIGIITIISGVILFIFSLKIRLSVTKDLFELSNELQAYGEFQSAAINMFNETMALRLATETSYGQILSKVEDHIKSQHLLLTTELNRLQQKEKALLSGKKDETLN